MRWRARDGLSHIARLADQARSLQRALAPGAGRLRAGPDARVLDAANRAQVTDWPIDSPPRGSAGQGAGEVAAPAVSHRRFT